MDFGLITLAQTIGDDKRTSVQLYEDVLGDIQKAESLGFGTYWFGEHHFSRYGNIPSPSVFMAAAAQRTSKIRFGTAVILAPFYSPVRIAEEAAMVDVLSNGRLDLGLGRGYQPTELAGFHVEPETTRDWMEDTIALCKEIWTTGKAEFRGAIHEFDLPEFRLMPVQEGGPPIWMACISPQSFDRAGELGLHILANPSISPMKMVKENIDRYRQALSNNGHDPSKFFIGISQEVYIADTAKEAQDTMQPYALNFHRTVASKVADPKGPMKTFELYSKSREHMERLTFEDLMETHAAIFADPKEAVERLKYYQSELEITHHIAWMDLGGIPVDVMRASMEKFGKEVIPAFREQTVGA